MRSPACFDSEAPWDAGHSSRPRRKAIAVNSPQDEQRPFDMEPRSPSPELTGGRQPELEPLREAAPAGAQPAEQTPPKKKGFRHGLLFEVVMVCTLALGLAFVLRTFIAQAYEIRGDSMQPTFTDGERVMISKLSPTVDTIDHGEIVIFSDPQNATRDLIKRVIGLPGDTVIVDLDEVRVNGVVIAEDYVLRSGGRSVHREQILGEGELYVLGDNRGNSKDSRDFGPISQSSVKGRVILRLWPLTHIRTFP